MASIGKLPASMEGAEGCLNIHNREALIFYCENCGEWSEDGSQAVKCKCGSESIFIETMTICSVPIMFEFVPVREDNSH